MWNRIASNRILDLKRKQQAQKKHIDALRNIKSRINNSAPKQYLFLNTKPKTRQLELCTNELTQKKEWKLISIILCSFRRWWIPPVTSDPNNKHILRILLTPPTVGKWKDKLMTLTNNLSEDYKEHLLNTHREGCQNPSETTPNLKPI